VADAVEHVDAEHTGKVKYLQQTIDRLKRDHEMSMSELRRRESSLLATLEHAALAMDAGTEETLRATLIDYLPEPVADAGPTHDEDPPRTGRA
jgi:hypothetical protein